MSTPILTPDVFYDGSSGNTPLSAEAVNRIWAALMQALVDELIARPLAASNSLNLRDLALVDASNGPVYLQAPQAIAVGQWGARKIDNTSNPVVITATGNDVLDEHNRTTYTLTSQDDDAVFAYASPGHFMFWRGRQQALPATTTSYGPIKIAGDLAGTADAIRVPGKENVGIAASLVAAHTIASDPHGDRGWANLNTGAQIQTHAQGSDPHGDRAYAAQQFVPLSWFDADGTLLPSHTSQLAITATFPVASQAAMLALTAQQGDVAIRTDTGATYILQGSDPTVLANWTLLPAVGKVASVNGQQGSVVLGFADVGAASTSDARITGAEQTSAKNAANGYAGLGATSLISAAQIPGATSSAYGGIKLAGGLGGTPDAPTIVGKENTGVAASLISTHTSATDPHGDRAYAASLLTGLHQVPPGGAAGWGLVKVSGNDYDYAWGAIGVSTNVQQDLKIVSVKNFGAVGNGTTDDTTAINNALANTPAGGVCYLPPGNYGVTAPIVIPPQVTLEGAHGETLIYTTNTPPSTPIATSLRPLASFAGVAVVRILGKTAGGYAYSAVGQKLRRVTIDGTLLPAGSGIKGVQVFGFCREVALEYVTVWASTGNGFDFAVDAAATGEQSTAPQSNRILHCVAHNVTGQGFAASNMPDSTFIDCNAQGATLNGFYLAGLMNGMLIGCRSEWSGQHGYYILSGYWGTGKGSGGMEMFGCQTDRNGWDGVRIDATGNGQILINGHTARRDGRNNNAGGGNYAAIQAFNATMPIVVNGLVVYPGVDDNAANTGVGNSPQFGVRAGGSTHVAVGGACYLHAQQAAFSDNGGNGLFYRGPGIATATGTSDAPVRVGPTAPTPVAEPVNTQATVTGAYTIPDIGTATVHDLTLTGAATLTFPTAAPGKSFTMVLRQDATGGRTATWPAAAILKWPSAVPPTLTTTASAVDVLTFVASGTAWLGSLAAKDVR